MNKNLIFLIPPSEGKSDTSSQPPMKKVSPQTFEALERLKKFDGDPAKLYGVKGAALNKAISMNMNVLSSETIAAINRYTGVVYQAFEYNSLDKEQKRFANRHIRIVSALFGLLSPQTHIPPYKLKMDKLNLNQLWRPINKLTLRNSFVVDLLPQAHKKAVEYSNGIQIKFTLQKNGQTKAAGHQGKWIKGRFLRWICQNNITEIEELKNFKEEGYTWKNQQFIKIVA